jgi:RNA polymerase sigma-70 factor (ECF subfamily)
LDAYHASLVRVAQVYVRDRQVAEDVAQDTWLAVIRGIDRFEARSSFRTWLFSILANQARKRGERERRSVPFSTLAARDTEDGPTVDPDRFLPEDAARWAGHWSAAPRPWDMPEERLIGRETLDVIAAAIETLPEAQRTVISLRDVEGLDSSEVCELLDISEGNQRVLLHRARAKVRTALERYMDGEASR